MESSDKVHLKKKNKGSGAVAVPFMIGAAVATAATLAYEHRGEIKKGIKKIVNLVTGKSDEVPVKSSNPHPVPLSIPSEDERYIQDISAFICPISQEVMKDPVITPYGHCYDRESITDWLSSHRTDPLTNQPLSLEDLKPCFALKSAIEETIRTQKNAERTQL